MRAGRMRGGLRRIDSARPRGRRTAPDCSDCPSDCASSPGCGRGWGGLCLVVLGAARDQERIDGEGGARGSGQGQDRGTSAWD